MTGINDVFVEKDRSNCMPNEEVKNVFYKWLENVKVGARL